ncbi:DUF1576 domain-containing protein [Pseudochelatococcus contaminans]|uniref:DUF1576 domain-containing protein n=1 Tax=Pseudochelatococcus contaminans TaxID=1538103 RepID=A0A7W5Z3B4_9HYPH|nr:DUF1576 domain-containing protein [Pseudochelatococcus contaminans]MBB3809381.1 hypothetical protein [Pseudochelatococcus contaminans]
MSAILRRMRQAAAQRFSGSPPSSPATAPSAPTTDGRALLVAALGAAAFMAFAFMVDPAGDVLAGFVRILLVRDTLITDYIGVGGIGGAFFNAGLTTLLSIACYYLCGARLSAATVACLFLMLGFSLFGKNVLNIWCTVAGVYLYARFRGDPFSVHINTAFFGAALAPMFSEILFSTALSLPVSLPLAVATSLVSGFVLPPVAAHLFRTHMGYNLYNMGFVAGIVGTLIVAIYKSYGFVPAPVMIWTSGNTLVLGSFLVVGFGALIMGGILLDRRWLVGFKTILASSGQAPTDFIALAGLGATLVNMGLSGLVGLGYILLIGADLNGPVIGGIFAIVGFAAMGKHPGNFTPIIIGVFLGSLAKPWNANDPAIVLAALFGTTLAPIAGRFGWHWGLAAGFLHSSAALAVGALHGGLNLYNNGFAAGIVAAVLVPIILAIRERQAPPQSGPAP